jgi:hypothetical protein
MSSVIAVVLIKAVLVTRMRIRVTARLSTPSGLMTSPRAPAVRSLVTLGTRAVVEPWVIASKFSPLLGASNLVS